MEIKDQKREKWIGTVMNSLEGMERPEVPASVYGKIERQLNGNPLIGLNRSTIPIRTVSIAAIIVFLLISVNVFLLSRQVQRPHRSDIEQVANYYGLTDNNNILDAL